MALAGEVSVCVCGGGGGGGGVGGVYVPHLALCLVPFYIRHVPVSIYNVFYFRGYSTIAPSCS